MKFLKYLYCLFFGLSTLCTQMAILIGNYSLSEKYGYSSLSFALHGMVCFVAYLLLEDGVVR